MDVSLTLCHMAITASHEDLLIYHPIQTVGLMTTEVMSCSLRAGFSPEIQLAFAKSKTTRTPTNPPHGSSTPMRLHRDKASNHYDGFES